MNRIVVSFTGQNGLTSTCDACGFTQTGGAEHVELNDRYAGRCCPACLAVRTVHLDAGGDEINAINYRLDQRLALYRARHCEFESRYRATWKFISRHLINPAERILEVGSNTGALVEFLGRTADAKITSVERNSTLAAHQRTKGLDCHTSVDDIGEQTRFDVIILMDVLEHVVKCAELLASLRCRLTKDGLIFLQFPNSGSLAARRARTRWSWWEAPDHVHHFRTESMTHLAAASGCRIEALRTVSPLLDDLDAVLPSGPGSRILHKVNGYIALNRLITIGVGHSGSLIQVLLSNNVEGSIVV